MDISVPYTLSTGGGTIVFNNGNLNSYTDLFWITNGTGLDGAPLRTPIDNAPQADGGLIHTFWKGPRHVVIEGIFLIQSTHVMTSIRLARNSMAQSLLTALNSIYQADGTLSWTPAGGSLHTLTVRNDVPLNTVYGDNYLSYNFSFGLVAASPSY